MKFKLGNIEVELDPVEVSLIPNDIKKLRGLTGLSLDAFARLCDVSQSAAYSWEAGLRKPSHRSTKKICEIIQSIYQRQNGKKESQTI